MKAIHQTAEVFAAPLRPFPSSLTAAPDSIQPQRGVLMIDNHHSVPASLSTSLAVSRPHLPISLVKPSHPAGTSRSLQHVPDTRDTRSVSEFSIPEPQDNEDDSQPPQKRQCVRKAQQKRCRRCRSLECPGSGGIEHCQVECKVPCKKCGQLIGCRGVDKGRKCTSVGSGSLV
ncbi:hypothetical protein FPV67DRAFT_1465355, partial [Lyophyllum atratum]